MRIGCYGYFKLKICIGGFSVVMHKFLKDYAYRKKGIFRLMLKQNLLRLDTMDSVIVMGACSKENHSSEMCMLRVVAPSTHISV